MRLALKLTLLTILTFCAASHCADLDATVRMCGVGDSEDVIKLLDEKLLTLVEKQERPTTSGSEAESPSVSHRWTEQDADAGEFKTGRPNKQQRNEMYRQKIDWEKASRQARRQRRETEKGWVAVALADLKEEKDYLGCYGVEGYFPRSIGKLGDLAS